LGVPGTAQGITSFDVWVDSHDVVHQMTMTSAPTGEVCYDVAGGHAACAMPGGQLTGPSGAAPSVGSVVFTVKIEFAHLGQPESVTAPTGAVDVDGLG
jgi:hypothetical protein